jgi:DNA helicase II / ATP-dependent DNA helicase PcrA
MNNLKIIIAGAGAGKTHKLKEEVLKCLPDLEPCYHCSVITFTNAATEELRKRLSQEVKITPNESVH